MVDGCCWSPVLLFCCFVLCFHSHEYCARFRMMFSSRSSQQEREGKGRAILLDYILGPLTHAHTSLLLLWCRIMSTIDSDSLDDTIQQFYIELEENRRRFKPLLNLAVEDHDNTDALLKGLLQSQSFDEQILAAVVSIYTLLQKLHTFINQHSSSFDSLSEIQLMVKNCLLKGHLFIVDLWTCMITLLDAAVDFKQPCVARCFELTLRTVMLLYDSDSSSTLTTVKMDTIQQHYVLYQKKVLRAHCKSFIAQLVSFRREARSLTNISMRQYLEQPRPSTLHTEDHIVDRGILMSKQPHADTLSNILGEASHLIHPLALWIQGYHPILEEPTVGTDEEKTLTQGIVQTCRDAIQILNKEAQSLAVTVGNWLLIDYGYMPDPMAPKQHTSNNNNKDPFLQTTIATQNEKPLSHLDSTLDEMSFLCQVISRYGLFLNLIASLSSFSHEPSEQINSNTVTGEIFTFLQEVTLFYATTEIELSKAKFSQALAMAAPIDIVLGKQMFVPSIVEDAYYISTRAMERAYASMCNRALSMVIHFICELWSLTLSHQNEEDGGEVMAIGMGAIYSSLIHQVGCKEEHFYLAAHPHVQDKGGGSTNKNLPSSSNGDSTFTGGFATALLDALDSDEAKSSGTVAAKSMRRNIPKAPSSGSSWSRGVGLHQYHLDSRFCTLNGIQSAATACDGLLSFLDSISDEVAARDTNEITTSKRNSTSMLDLAKAELQSHSKSYINLLENHIQDIVFEYLGRVLDTSSSPPLIASLPSSPPFHRLYYNMTHETYNLDASSFQKADDGKRLDEEWIQPLRESRLVHELVSCKCDAHVNIVIAKEISHHVSTLVLDTIMNQRKVFSEYGSIILSRQVRMLEDFCTSLIHHDNILSTESSAGASFEILHQFRRLTQAVAILQLEKPSDWTAFFYTIGSPNDASLSKDEIRQVMQLRVDFSEDAVAKVCQ